MVGEVRQRVERTRQDVMMHRSGDGSRSTGSPSTSRGKEAMSLYEALAARCAVDSDVG